MPERSFVSGKGTATPHPVLLPQLEEGQLLYLVDQQQLHTKTLQAGNFVTSFTSRYRVVPERARLRAPCGPSGEALMFASSGYRATAERYSIWKLVVYNE